MSDYNYESESESENDLSKKNYKKFKNILKSRIKDYDFFCKYSNEKQQEIIDKTKKLKENVTIEKPIILHIIELDIKTEFKIIAFNKLQQLENMKDKSGGEYYKLKVWIDSFIKIPFNKLLNFELKYNSINSNECSNFIENAKNILDNVVYGLNDAKLQILQLIGLWLVNPNAAGYSIAIKGPMGTGKTTLIKEGISKILNRPFAMVALGGCSDSSFLEGHDYTYEGSKYGKIVDILIQSKCMNPIILFDELDKLSETHKGDEITGILTHITDNTQNACYRDKYFSEFELNISKALLVFSYNDESKINSILKDRMYKIETIGYTTNEKKIIVEKYIIPSVSKEVAIDSNNIILDDNIIEYIIKNYTDNEYGVRNLKRCIETIYTKINLFRLLNKDSNIIDNNIKIKLDITNPLKITEKIVDKLLTKKNIVNTPPFGMYN